MRYGGLGLGVQAANQGRVAVAEPAHGPRQPYEHRDCGLTEEEFDGAVDVLAHFADAVGQLDQAFHLGVYDFVAAAFAFYSYVAEEGVQAEAEFLRHGDAWKKCGGVKTIPGVFIFS